MELLKFNTNNEQYYSEEFKRGFDCGAKRQFEADSVGRNGKWIDDERSEFYYANCSECGYQMDVHAERGYFNYCPNCGALMSESLKMAKSCENFAESFQKGLVKADIVFRGKCMACGEEIEDDDLFFCKKCREDMRGEEE